MLGGGFSPKALWVPPPMPYARCTVVRVTFDTLYLLDELCARAHALQGAWPRGMTMVANKNIIPPVFVTFVHEP